MTGKAAFITLLTYLTLASSSTRAADEGHDTPLSLSDLAPYRAALEKRPTGTSTPAQAVTFRDLWDHPESYQGRHVRVNGRVVRRFRQGTFGTFPPLTEVWAVSPVGDPFCLVFPTPAGSGRDEASPGASIRFEGTFLRRLQYQGGDTARLAPLIVGDAPPSVTTPAPAKGRSSDAPEPGLSDGRLTRFEWALGLFVVAFLALTLARRHLLGPGRRPTRRSRDEEPPPEFIDPT